MKAKKKVLSIVMAATCISTLATFNISAEPTDYFSTFSTSADYDDVPPTEVEMNDIDDDNAATDVYYDGSGIYETMAVTATLPTSPSSATTISGGSTPYFFGTYNLKAGSAGYVKYTPTVSINCSVYTTGSTDTYLEIYDNVSCTSPIYSNNNSGHGNNAKIYRYLTAGTTYYIKVKGASTTASGTYTLVFHRGVPTSRSEKSDMFSTFNSDTYKEYTNCYTYAMGYYYHPTTGKKFGYKGCNPGGFSGNPTSFSDLANATTAKAAIEAALTADCNLIGGDWAEISATAQPRQGYYKVALVLDPGSDYHWYRQLPNGQWGHKPGASEARNKDYNNKIIYRPDQCERDTSVMYPNSHYNYTDFLGWYEIKVTAPVPPVSTYTVEEDKKEYPINLELTMDNINTLYAGMSYESAMDILGEPHDYVGSGMIGDVYRLKDGTKIVVYYRLGVIDAITYYPEAGQRSVIIAQ